jgi:zinc D-Ala-D-Ala dipeptidase
MLGHNNKEPKTEVDEPLVSLVAISKKINIYPYYFYHHIPGSSSEIFLRQGAAERLCKAVELLPPNLNLVVLDGWRSFETQFAIYHNTKKMFQQMGYSLKKIDEELAKYVAIPSKCPLSPSPHLTGGAVDVTLADENGWLNMGTDFDEFHEKAKSNWFELKPLLTSKEITIRENRRLLKHTMEAAGFTVNEDEWWHFDFGNQSWASISNNIPIYTYVERMGC